MLTLLTRLKEYLDGHESDIFGYMLQNELEPQVRAANRPSHEAALFLLTGAGRSLGVDAFLRPRLEQVGARGDRVARLLIWLT